MNFLRENYFPLESKGKKIAWKLINIFKEILNGNFIGNFKGKL
jgi:hypothetical protein